MESEVVIVGAGLVGASLACALADAGVANLLVDSRASVAAPEEAFDQRVYAIRPASVSFLRRCGIWSKVDPERVCPVHEMIVFGDRGARLAFDALSAGLPALAFIVEDANLQRAALAALGERPLATRLTDRRCRDATWNDDGVRILLDDATQVTAGLAVAADGADSRLRALAGIEAQVRPYLQRAVVANFAAAEPHRNVAYQWFRADGVLALLPLPGERVSMVWSTSPEHADELVALPLPALADRVAAASGALLGELRAAGPATAFPLRLMRVGRVVAPRLVLVGDAAHNVHPLAGQGLNLGLADAAELARLVAARLPAEPVWSSALLARYRRSRAEEVAAMQLATDGLHRLFEMRLPGAAWLRNTGLRITDRLSPIKRVLMKHAAGEAVE